jgi:hypothetical protein
MGEGRLAVERWLRQVKVMPPPDPKPLKPRASDSTDKPATKQHPLSRAAERALAEAAARRAADDRAAPDRPKEIQGRDGPEPTRYGDWEIKGLTSDF